MGVLFTLFGVLCLIGNLYFIPIMLLGLYKNAFFRNLSRDIVFYSWRFFVYCTRILGYLQCEYRGFENLGKSGQIIIANHPSLLDVVLILSRIRRINCIIKADLCKNIFLFAAIKASGYIPNTANESLLENSISTLKNGESLLIFPEGTRTKKSIIFHKAASYIAINGAKSLVVIFIKMHPRSLKKGAKWYETPKNRINFCLSVGEILDLSQFECGLSPPLRVRKLHKKLGEIYDKEFENERFD